jgi:putative SOS response-associated peptidase YedK
MRSPGGTGHRCLCILGEWWKAQDEALLRTFAILTTSANAVVRVLHERMPVIIEPDAWPVWLGEDSGVAAHLMPPGR